MGCTAPAKVPTRRGPPGREVQLTMCPARYVTQDIVDLVATWNRSGRQLSLADQLRLPIPYLDAIDYAHSQQLQREQHELKKARDGAARARTGAPIPER